MHLIGATLFISQSPVETSFLKKQLLHHYKHQNPKKSRKRLLSLHQIGKDFSHIHPFLHSIFFSRQYRTILIFPERLLYVPSYTSIQHRQAMRKSRNHRALFYYFSNLFWILTQQHHRQFFGKEIPTHIRTANFRWRKENYNIARISSKQNNQLF